jgi:hypothetical protein
MTNEKVYSKPSEVRAEDEAVAVDGPDGVHIKLTPEAAEETSDRLLQGAMIARGKRIMKKLPQRPN